MIGLIRDRAQIDEIIDRYLRNKKIIFTQNFQLRNAMRDIADEKVLEVFPQFERVFAIEKKLLKQGDTGYELFYSLSNNLTFSIATIPKGDNLLFTHAIEYKRNLGKRFNIG